MATVDIISLAEAQLNPQLTSVDETWLESLITAASAALENNPYYIIGTLASGGEDFSSGFEDLKECVIKMITMLIASTNTSIDNGQIQSESLGDYSYSLGQMAKYLLTPEISFLLVPYMRRSAPSVVKKCLRRAPINVSTDDPFRVW